MMRGGQPPQTPFPTFPAECMKPERRKRGGKENDQVGRHGRRWKGEDVDG